MFYKRLLILFYCIISTFIHAEENNIFFMVETSIANYTPFFLAGNKTLTINSFNQESDISETNDFAIPPMTLAQQTHKEKTFFNIEYTKISLKTADDEILTCQPSSLLFKSKVSGTKTTLVVYYNEYEHTCLIEQI